MIRNQINGILLIDKPQGLSSNGILQKIKFLYYAKSAGHTGSLDPLATGLLPICFGEATKFSQYLLDSDKTYTVTAQLGVRTTTSDREGEIVSERTVPDFSQKNLEKALDSFRGKIQQVPSMFSALKYQGKPLYFYARQGITIERPAREIEIYRCDLLDHASHQLQLKIHCSKGTYVRTLVDDLGELLGCGAHVAELRRTQVGHFTEDQMISFEKLSSFTEQERIAQLLPMESALQGLPRVFISTATASFVRKGQAVLVPKAPSKGFVCIMEENQFLGVGEVLSDGKIAPRRLINTQPYV